METFITISIALSLLIYYSIRIIRSSENPNREARIKEFLSDTIARNTLDRQTYYRQVYLKSEAWKRKRHVVLKRDNWRCVFCGRPATQVHHERYAKRNIGKEPIKWLVSICKSCHELKHK